jgi:hypothetical protein
MLPFKERDNILESMEKHNVKLTKAFQRYRQVNNIEIPEIDEDGEIELKDQKSLVDIYNSHKTALQNILKCAANLKKDIEDIENFFEKGKEWEQELMDKLNKRPTEYTQENIRNVFFTLINPFLLGNYLVFEGNSLEKNDRVDNFKIVNGIIYGDTLDRDTNIYSSAIDMNLLQYKQIIVERLQNNKIRLENILNILNELKIEIIPRDLSKLKCKCNCSIMDQPCKHTIALYFKFIDNMVINKDIVIELFGIK